MKAGNQAVKDMFWLYKIRGDYPSEKKNEMET